MIKDLSDVENLLKEVMYRNSEEFIEKEVMWVLKMGCMFGAENVTEPPTLRKEANVITAFCFRNTELENAHASNTEEELTDRFVDKLMLQSSKRLGEWLKMREALLECIPGINAYLLLRQKPQRLM
ncbi:hypothetical protein [Alkalihalobacillus deserti]|uniref:hypothetical protein n=1 Tax=Alkalihalobacillus deserti TaxID=2879466 RepID=UPI001D14EAB0|nr:hypothetical protein [Alkalihalobacillus deserti]